MNDRSNDRFQCNENGLKLQVLFMLPADMQLSSKVKGNIGYYYFDYINHQSQIKDSCFLCFNPFACGDYLGLNLMVYIFVLQCVQYILD